MLIIYLSMMSVVRLLMTTDGRTILSEVQPNLRHYPGICVEEMEKITNF
jgi:hypothetical protein